MGIHRKAILPGEIQTSRNRYVLRRDVEQDEAPFFQYHTEFWDHADDEIMENALWKDFIHCSVGIMKALGGSHSTTTAVGVSAPHAVSAKLEEWYHSPPLSGSLLPSNYGMDVCVLTQGVPDQMLEAFFDAVVLGMNEFHSVKIFGQPFTELAEQREEWLADLPEKGQPILTMQLTHHPMLHMQYNPEKISFTHIAAAAGEVMAKHNKVLEVHEL